MTQPLDESRRLESLRRFQILDTAAEKAFDDLTRIAAAICEAPISLVSLVDETRQWFKAKVGLDVDETPREHAFCSHAIQGPEVMVVEDASRDERFADNPLVLGEPRIRFYAGAPLIVADGAALGTLCVIDRRPRSLSIAQRNTLAVLRDAVVSQLELRRTTAELGWMRELLSMCAWCRRVKAGGSDDGQHWQPLHDFVEAKAALTHGICPDCSQHAMAGGALD